MFANRDLKNSFDDTRYENAESISPIPALLAVIQDKKLWLPADFNQLEENHLAHCYNGVGPELWSPKFRRAITRALSHLEAPALIHDVEFTRGGSYRQFTMANFRLIYNACKDGHPLCGLLAGLLCQFFGWSNWQKGGANHATQ